MYLLKEIAFDEYKINGKVIFPKHGSHEVAKLVAKRLWSTIFQEKIMDTVFKEKLYEN